MMIVYDSTVSMQTMYQSMSYFYAEIIFFYAESLLPPSWTYKTNGISIEVIWLTHLEMNVGWFH